MSVIQYILGGALILLSIAMVVIVLMQESRSAGLSGAIAGGADTFLSKNKARTADAILKRLTKWLVALFLVLAVVGVIIF